VPEDRRTEGLIAVRTAAENIVLGSGRSSGGLGYASRRRVMRAARDAARRVRLPEHRLGVPAGVLSGGNQQKVMLARALVARPSVLLVDEPTRGVDVGAKAEILRLLLDLADEGTAVVVVSEEIDELLAVVDRVLVLRVGRIVAEHRAVDVRLDQVLNEMFPASAAPELEEVS
jgi:ABC-type sugar transport system ATPase subunit